MNTTKRAPAAWAEQATERLLDLATMAIAVLYWQICDSDDRAAMERARTTEGSPAPQPNRSRHSASIR
ncbi:hypothetical protein Poly30_51830 [Planctomycetes bacterium Poly30]|uniref:Uncharacterized protein n=1 Tax=Saltatorellus ferox TaxID=2528018 RepID=A0A518EZW0_9BACT|nr:hypothetical protein Poly30_51830 [Planctomycetes bacterium Poly30]